MDAMDEGGGGWEKLAPEELTKLRASAQMAEPISEEPEGLEEYDGLGG